MSLIDGVSFRYDPEHDLMLIDVLGAQKRRNGMVVYEELESAPGIHVGWYEDDESETVVSFNILDYELKNRKKAQRMFPQFQFPTPEEVR